MKMRAAIWKRTDITIYSDLRAVDYGTRSAPPFDRKAQCANRNRGGPYAWQFALRAFELNVFRGLRAISAKLANPSCWDRLGNYSALPRGAVTATLAAARSFLTTVPQWRFRPRVSAACGPKFGILLGRSPLISAVNCGRGEGPVNLTELKMTSNILKFSALLIPLLSPIVGHAQGIVGGATMARTREMPPPAHLAPSSAVYPAVSMACLASINGPASATMRGASRGPSYQYQEEVREGAILPQEGLEYYEVPPEQGVIVMLLAVIRRFL
jgi:hypothetical protein